MMGKYGRYLATSMLLLIAVLLVTAAPKAVTAESLAQI